MAKKLELKPECKKFRVLIQKRLDGDITPEENTELDEHLADCTDCLDELTSFASIDLMLNEISDQPVDVPDGFFEALENELEEVKPVRGINWIFNHPIFTKHKELSLGIASVFMVGVLILGISAGFSTTETMNYADQLGPTESNALILTNSGDQLVMPGDVGDAERYNAVLDELERAYEEALGQSDETDEGYIHTSWSGGESAAPIH